jgi:hypothetical protein
MERIYFTHRIAVAADASKRVSFAPTDAATTWKNVGLAIVPGETSAAHATDYADLTLKKGSTALMTARSTNSGTGSALTQNVGEALTITGTGTNLECTLAAPHHFLIDATPGAGVAVDITVMAVYEVVR